MMMIRSLAATTLLRIRTEPYESYLQSSSSLAKRCLLSAASCDGPVHLFVCMSIAKMQITRVSQKLSNLEQRCPLTTYSKLSLPTLDLGIPGLPPLPSPPLPPYFPGGPTP